MPKKLTVGLAHFNDYDGVYFSIQALRMYHDINDVEIVVIDNSPATVAGKAVSKFVDSISSARYVPYEEKIGPANAKDRIFREAQTEFVLCMDCHVLLVPGAVKRLIDWYEFNRDNKDLLTGPLIYDNLRDISTHFDLVWRDNMLGIWSRAWMCKCGRYFSIPIWNGEIIIHDLMYSDISRTQCPCGLIYPKIPYTGHEPAFYNIGCKPLGCNYNDPAFEIPAHGMGLFSCRRDAWLGFNSEFRGFGGEEGYIHAKYRKAGHKCLNLPFLGWSHRFLRPNGVAYPLNYWDRIRNYVIGRQELGMGIEDIRDHFVGLKKRMREGRVSFEEVIDEKSWNYLIEDPVGHIDPPCQTCGNFGSTIDEVFSWTEQHPHNMGRHMPRFRELASKCEHITAMVKQKEFDVTLLAGHPKVLRVYTLEPAAIHKHLAKLCGDLVDYKSQHIDWMTLDDIEETDLLVIHSIHQADRLYAELSRFGHRVRHYILLRSTGAYGEIGEPSGPGLFPAMRKYMREHPEWSVVEHDEDDYGYTILSRDITDKKKLPPLTKMVWNYTKALLKHAAAGIKTARIETIESRLDICALCTQRTLNRCAVCGCFLDEGPRERDGKVLWPESVCNLGEWFEEE